MSDDAFLAGYGAAQACVTARPLFHVLGRRSGSLARGARLGAALYNPIWTSAVEAPGDFGLALLGFVLLIVWRAPPLVVVLISALGGIGLVYLPS